MYTVSEVFLQAIQENSRTYKWSGVITANDGTDYPFTDKDIVKGSGYITNQCSGTTEIEIGSVYSAELGITIYSNVNRYSMIGGQITLYFHLKVSDQTYEIIPMGVFDISEANRTIHCLEIKAYDHMLRFDKTFTNKVTSGSPYDLLQLACNNCNVELAHNQDEIDTLSNGSVILGIYAENDIETWRDLIYYVAQMLGSFATINREGKLALRKYGQEPVMNISDLQRYTSSFSDYVTRYTALRSVNSRTQESEYYALEEDDGLTMTLGSNPLIQYGTQTVRKSILNNVLSDISLINYVPFDSTTIGNPALDLGDVISFSGGHADNTKCTCITSIIYRINGKHQLKCVGKNPSLAQAKSKTDKNIAGLLSQIVAGKVVAKTYVNASNYAINSALTEIISMDLLSNETTSAQFHTTILLKISTNIIQKEGTATVVLSGESSSVTWEYEVEDKAVAEVVYELNGNMIGTHQPKESWYSGYHTLTLFYPLEELLENTTNEWKVYLRMIQGTAEIEPEGIIASVYGQGIATTTEAEWDGYLEVEDKVTLFAFGLGMIPIEDSGTVRHMQTERIYGVADTTPLFSSGLSHKEISECNILKSMQIESTNVVQDHIGLFAYGLVLCQ